MSDMFAEPNVELEQRSDGTQLLRSRTALARHEDHLGQLLDRWVDLRPNHPFLAERQDDGWRRMTYFEVYQAARSLGQAFLELGLGPGWPIMILSGNSIDHALVALGGLITGIPVAPISPAYSLMSSDFGRVHHIVDLIEPGLVFVEDATPFSGVLESLDLSARNVLTGSGDGMTPGWLDLQDLLETAPGGAVDQAYGTLGPNSVAKYLFTSGSTGTPKGVINTHQMLCANQQQVAQCWPFLEDRPPVLLDWLPWNHTFGGNHNFNLVLRHGGTLYIDGGKPTPEKIEETVDNLRDVSPTLYFNVPLGYAQLQPYLEQDQALAKKFFGALQLLFYAGSALPQELWDRISRLAADVRGTPITFATAWGSTETAPMATCVHFPTDRAGIVGLPAPGVEIKLLPSGGKLELRVRGPNVTPGYVGAPELTRQAFDEEGFYKIGDAGRLADPSDLAMGLVFDGRVAEDFKLSSGTWVHVGAVRLATIDAAAPFLQDTVVCGHDQESVTLMAWLNESAAATAIGAIPDPSLALTTHADVRAVLVDRFRHYNDANPGSSTRVSRLILLNDPPSIDAGEITDKGYVNQRAARERRADIVERLYAESSDADVLIL